MLSKTSENSIISGNERDIEKQNSEVRIQKKTESVNVASALSF
jgi:hypothetical protein